MSEKICHFSEDYPQIPELVTGLRLVADTLLAANRLLWQRGIPLKLSYIAPADSDKNQLIACELINDATGPKFYVKSEDVQEIK